VVLAQEHEVATLIHNGASLLVRNPHLAAATERWLGDLQGAQAASGEPEGYCAALFACAWHLMVQRTAYLDAALATVWRRKANGFRRCHLCGQRRRFAAGGPARKRGLPVAIRLHLATKRR